MSCGQGHLPMPMLFDWSGLQRDEHITLSTESPLHTGKYKCTVIEASPTTLRVSMPMDEGKLVFVPVGTRIDVTVETEDGLRHAPAVVTERRGGGERSLFLQLLNGDGASEGDAVCKTIAVTSGKGGVGKTFFVIALGVALAELDLRVCIIDVDLGTANVDVLLNLAPAFNLGHVILGQKGIFDVLMEGPSGLIVLPGGSGLQQIREMSSGRFADLHDQFKLLEQFADIILLDTGSGLGRSVTRFAAAADECIVVTTPEPHAIVDSYAFMKVFAEGSAPRELHLVVNRVFDGEEGRAVADKMTFAAQRFLNTQLHYLGSIAEDEAVGRSVRLQQPLLTAYGKAVAAGDVRRIARALRKSLPGSDEAGITGGEDRPPSLLQRLRQLFVR